MTTPTERARQVIAWAAHNGINVIESGETSIKEGFEVLLGSGERHARLAFYEKTSDYVDLFEHGRMVQHSFCSLHWREPLRAFLTAKPPRVMLEVVSPLPPPVTVNLDSPSYTAEVVLRARFKDAADVALLLAAVETGRVFIERAP